MNKRIAIVVALCLIFVSNLIGENSLFLAQGKDGGNLQQSSIISGYIQVDDGKIFYQRAGHGEPIIMIHDGILHRVTWDNQFTAFAENYTVIRYDRRGYGRSNNPEKPYSDLNDLNRIFEELKIDQAILMGMSYGGSLAIDFALENPKKVKYLVLVGSIVSGYGFTQHFYERGGHLGGHVMEVYGADSETFRKYWFTKDPYSIYAKNVAAREKARQLLEENPHNMDFEKFNLLQGPKRQALKHLHEIQVYTLIILGEYDIPDVHAHAGAIEAGIPNARREIINNSGHLVPMEQPEVFNKLVMDFFKEEEFFAIIKSKGIDNAIELFKKLQKDDPEIVVFKENRMNQLGYQHLQSGNYKEAIKVFKLNVLAYPNSWNAYDSLAEAYMQNGDKELAIENYKKSLELNPQNNNAKTKLEILEKDKE